MSNIEEVRSQGIEFVSLLKDVSLNIRDFKLFGDGSNNNINIYYYQDGLLDKTVGQFFVKMPDKLAESLPGSYISPDIFLQELGHKESIKSQILGDFTSKGQRLFNHEEDHFKVNVFHGSTSDVPREITQLAASESFTEMVRIEYQKALADIIEPVLRYRQNHESAVAIRIVEDCLATGDSILGVLSALYNKTKVNELGRVRVDVAVATTQSILILRKFAKDNGIELELNIGYLAFGLSKGKRTPGKGLEHSNYITYPAPLLQEFDDLFFDLGWNIEELVGKKRTKKHRDGIQVVGDMGDAAQSVDKSFDRDIPWNALRNDTHGARKADLFNKQINFKNNIHPTLLFMANGGYMMRSFFQYFLKPNLKKTSGLMISAKRRFDEGEDGIGAQGLGFGVLLSDIPKQLIIHE